MNNLFFIIFCISFLCIPIFVLWALINLIRRKPAKKRFIYSGISALVLIISTIGFGLTMDEEPALNNSVDIVSESPSTATESTASTPTAMPKPTKVPTPKPIKTPTPQPTEMPTPQPTETPTPQPTETPTPQPTEASKQVFSPTETPKQQTEKTPEPQTIGNSASGSNENNFNTYDNPEQQQTADTYVLNTSRHKIHHPSCSSVPKIAPKNYATSNSSIAELEAQGYTTCGNCFK